MAQLPACCCCVLRHSGRTHTLWSRRHQAVVTLLPGCRKTHKSKRAGHCPALFCATCASRSHARLRLHSPSAAAVSASISPLRLLPPRAVRSGSCPVYTRPPAPALLHPSYCTHPPYLAPHTAASCAPGRPGAQRSSTEFPQSPTAIFVVANWKWSYVLTSNCQDHPHAVSENSERKTQPVRGAPD